MIKSELDPASDSWFDQVYVGYHPRVFRYVIRLGVDPDQQEDLVAEVFATAWRKREALAAAQVSPGVAPWLLATARRLAANHRRSLMRRGALYDRLALHAATLGSDEHEPHSVVLEAMSRLSVRDREVLALATWDGLSHDEIAHVLRCSSNAVAQRISRARSNLRKLLITVLPDQNESDHVRVR